MRTEIVTALRRAEYEYAVYNARPVIEAARKAGCTTGVHVRDFLNGVGVPAPKSKEWSVLSVNRAIHNLVEGGLKEWTRHRGKRNPYLENLRKDAFAKAVAECRALYEQGAFDDDEDEFGDDAGDK